MFTVTDSEFDAICARDPALDGQFFYAVRTTGVYCRPSCAARPALRQNLSIHPSCAAAEAAGFRPCKRCRPNEPSLAFRHDQAVERACRMIEAADTLPTLVALAAAAGLSPYHFHRVFRAVTGITPKAYASAQQATRMTEELQRANSVTEAIYSAGFNASSRFYAQVDARLGMTPTAFRKGGAGASIQFAVGACTLGHVLAASTVRGICAILLGADPAALLRDLQDRFPHAEITGGDPVFEQTIGQVIALVESPGRRHDLPLDIGGTAFQQRVWEALRKVPSGQTVSYAEIARAIGRPTASRAVAQACGANPIAVAIPCHRVVRTGGALSGYRWGIERKAALLEREVAPSPGLHGRGPGRGR